MRRVTGQAAGFLRQSDPEADRLRASIRGAARWQTRSLPAPPATAGLNERSQACAAVRGGAAAAARPAGRVRQSRPQRSPRQVRRPIPRATASRPRHGDRARPPCPRGRLLARERHAPARRTERNPTQPNPAASSCSRVSRCTAPPRSSWRATGPAANEAVNARAASGKPGPATRKGQDGRLAPESADEGWQEQPRIASQPPRPSLSVVARFIH